MCRYRPDRRHPDRRGEALGQDHGRREKRDSLGEGEALEETVNIVKIADYLDGAKQYLVSAIGGTICLLTYFKIPPFKHLTLDGFATGGVIIAMISGYIRAITYKPGALSGAKMFKQPDGTTVVVRPSQEVKI